MEKSKDATGVKGLSCLDRIVNNVHVYRKKVKKPKEKGVPIYKLFSFSDKLDYSLIVFGLFCSCVSGCLFPVVFIFYGRIAGIYVDYENYIKNETIPLNSTDVTKCDIVRTMPNYTDFDARIQSNIISYIAIAFASLFANYFSNVSFNIAAARQVRRIRQRLFEAVLRQDMAFFDKNNPGELNSLLTANLEKITGAINFKFSDFVTQLVRGCACIILSLVLAWKFSIVFVLTILPLLVASLHLMIHYVKKYSIQEFASYGSAGKIAQESLSSLRTVISFGMHHKAIEKYGEKLLSAERISITKGKLKGFFEGAYFLLFNLVFGIGIYWAVYLNRTDCENFYPSNLVGSFFCIITSSLALGQAISFLTDLGAAKGVARKIFDTIKLKSSIDIMACPAKTIKDLRGQITFKDVHFNYPARPDKPVLQGFTLDIPAGKTVAFCGASGCGKSTTIGLLERYYLPKSGTIRVDGEDIEELDLNWLRSQMALVSQEPTLFTTSIRENIRLGRLDATDVEIEQAAKQANAHDFIMKLADNYETKVGERGIALSGGQKQRIAIARALVRNPKILLLDEATSALDNQSEKVVQDALDKAKVGRTTLIIAHRLTTIRNADLIVGFKDGTVMEQGTHDELIKIKGIYYELYTRQTYDKKEKVALKSINDTESEESESEAEDVDEIIETKKEKLEMKEADKKSKKFSVKRLREKEFNKPFHLEKKLLHVQKPELCWNIIGSLSQLINGALFPAIILIFTEIYNIFNIKDAAEQTQISLMYMGIIIAMGFLNFGVLYAYNYSLSLAGAKLTKRIRSKMFESMLRQEIAFHDMDENRSSILTTQLAVNPPLCKGLTSDKIGIMCQGFSGVGFSIIIAFVYNWKLSLVMILFVPVSFFAGVFSSRVATGNIKVKGIDAIDEGGRILIESVENVKTVVSLGRELHFIQEMKSLFQIGFKQILRGFFLEAVFYSISNTLIFFIQIVAFSYGWQLIQNDGLKSADLFKVYGTMTISSIILGRVYALLPDQKKARQSTKAAFKIMDRTSKIDSISNEGLKPDTLRGTIEFKDVTFEYPARPGVNVLDHFDMFINNGETNALVGHSGCGKSTTISLLLRFYDVTGGSIRLDGVDIRELNIEWLRSKIGIVSQEPVLFDYSIQENIMNGDLTRDNISLEEVIDAAKNSNIQSRIESLPQKYETVVGQRGSQLSGGEKQRIAIARALIRKPTILLLDEATSALDTESEQIVQDALDRAQIGRTSIVIAHRLSTIVNSDKIFVVSRGNVVESGKHAELLELKSAYFKLQNPSKKKTKLKTK